MFSVNPTEDKDHYKLIRISGNILLNKDEYLRYTGLSDSTKYAVLTLADVKSKLENHPYIIKAEVGFDGINGINAELIEKEPKALILKNNKFNFITKAGELLPVINQNMVAGYPIISNLKKDRKNSLNSGELKSAFRIIDVIKSVDKSMYASLAEINLRNGGDILLMFSGFPFPVIFGKKNEARKILALKTIRDELLKHNGKIFSIEYIDLRYKNKIFIGERKITELKG